MKTNYMIIVSMLILLCSEISYATPSHQETWRWRNDNGDVYSATWKDSLNHPMVITNYDNIRLRIGLYSSTIDTLNISLRYSENPGITPWIPITNIDTGKFFISSSQYLTDKKIYFKNQLLPSDSKYSYLKTVTFDSTNNYSLITDDGSMYELEYSLKPTSKIQPGSAYFFALFRNSFLIPDPTSSNKISYDYAVLMVPPINWNTEYSGTTKDLEDICFTDSNNGWAVGLNGTILKTTNGGGDWTSHSLSSENNLFHVTFIDAKTGWVDGYDTNYSAISYKTTDGGKTWISKLVGKNRIYFINKNIGWAIGNGIYKTINGGESWFLQSIADSIADYVLSDIFFTDENNGVAVGGGSGYRYFDWGYILRTTNGGDTWTPQLNRYEFHSLNSVFFIDAKNGWAVGGVNWGIFESSAFLRTTDGGETWIEQPSEISHPLSGVYFTDANNGLVVGTSGTILRTTNGGKNWVLQTSGTSVSLSAVSFADANNVIVVGSNGKILRSTNGGATSVPYNLKDKLPSHFLLSQNYPNPFNPTTTIIYSIPKQSLVTLKIYDILGREITTLVNEEKIAGTYKIDFNALSLASGVYFYRLEAGIYISTKKLILLK